MPHPGVILDHLKYRTNTVLSTESQHTSTVMVVPYVKSMEFREIPKIQPKEQILNEFSFHVIRLSACIKLTFCPSFPGSPDIFVKFKCVIEYKL